VGAILQRHRAARNEGDRQLGFTLIELLIVIVVLGILAAVSVLALSSISSQSATAACTSDARTVNIAINAYNAQTGGTPVVTQAALVPGYLQSFPSSSNYTISIVNGIEMVSTPNVAAAAYVGSSVNLCSTAGSSGTTTPTTTTLAPTATTTTPITTTLAPTTTTSTPTTTAGNQTNGVIASPSVPSNSNPYGAQEELSLTNQYPITALSITVNVVHTSGTAETQQYNGFPGGAVTQGTSTTGSVITYTWILNSGQTITAGYSSDNVYAQFSGSGNPPPQHLTSGDTWTVSSTSAGITSTLNGHF
jgi:prepilin-type N-terminal cleavage/methylation domain-containing protein